MNLMEVKINNGFWKERKELNKNISLYAVLKTFEESGRVRALTGENTDTLKSFGGELSNHTEYDYKTFTLRIFKEEF